MSELSNDDAEIGHDNLVLQRNKLASTRAQLAKKTFKFKRHCRNANHFAREISVLMLNERMYAANVARLERRLANS